MVALTKRHTGTGQYKVDHLRQCGPPCLKVSAAHIELQDVTSAEMRSRHFRLFIFKRIPVPCDDTEGLQ